MTDTPVRNTTARWRDLDRRHHLSPFTDYRDLKGAEAGSRIITRAEGIQLFDSEGEAFLDGMAGLWCVNVGYGRKELAEAAYRQMLELPYYNTFFKTATPPPVELSERLAALMPEKLNRVFYGSSGSESNDTVVRLARHFWKLEGQPEKQHFISRTYAYHGSTMASASLGGMTPMQEGFGLPLPGFHHVVPPYWYDFGGDLSPEEFGQKAARAIEEKILEIGPENVAAFIGEPIMGAGGVIVPPPGYWEEVQRICRQYDVLLVADEVICGFGRTGHWFASELFGIEPDLMTMAKGITSGYLPLSAVGVSDRIVEALLREGGEFAHGYTYSGHPAACAVALANLDIIEKEGLVERTRNETGPHLQQALHAAFDDHPLVGEVRGTGLIAAVELVKDKASRTHWEKLGRVGGICRDHCFANRVVIRAVRDAMVLSPPLVITPAEIDEMVVRLKHCIDATARDLGVL
ncbi:aspartate aminotransferase family protein [Aquibaculum arenosum]|uniref:Aspartate aminotransferase family protein n=1 Tax=Aquibaculum arenosum TaxID=3032591 RepID=A0ABT5YLY4_9PROT|nr:aspartate aminotransferase family protein [Fodinicurvata sp. CAU 1616]MDF2095944.1 aspartate aminotransferase family protein [Fodinicurvata sp. CAU 1616]